MSEIEPDMDVDVEEEELVVIEESTVLNVSVDPEMKFVDTYILSLISETSKAQVSDITRLTEELRVMTEAMYMWQSKCLKMEADKKELIRRSHIQLK